ncbi:MAG: alpha/beta hydrolase [Solirubrobacterales bacterium]
MSPTSFLPRHHGLRRRHRVVSMLIVSVVALSCATTATAAPKDRSKQGQSAATFAKRVDIGGGRSMYVECRGTGSPTVLLLSGSGTASDLWHAAKQKTPKVYPQIGKMTRTCTHDRPGVTHLDGELSRSDPVPQPTTPQNGVDDLDALLKAIDAKGPYVLVAHLVRGQHRPSVRR